jgi:hypothetical protein
MMNRNSIQRAAMLAAVVAALAPAAAQTTLGTATTTINITDSTVTTTTIANNLSWTVGSSTSQNLSGGNGGGPMISFTANSYTLTGQSAVSFGNTGGFCVELGQGVSVPGTYTYNYVGLQYLDYQSNSGGNGTGDYSGIANTGIGTAKAALVQYLFNNYYTAIAPATPASSTVQQNRAAFQFALWKLVTQNISGSVATANWSLNASANPTGNTFGYTIAPSGTDATILSQAQSEITAVINAYNTNPTPSATVQLIGLQSSSYQDLIQVLPTAVPETSTWAAAGFAAVAIGGTAWRRTRKTKQA